MDAAPLPDMENKKKVPVVPVLERLQEFQDDPDLPDLDNETVHKTARPDHAILEDDEADDELAHEGQDDRREDVSEGNPLHVGHYVGR
jgi:hypothetical protein